jgi:hypothetical protein
MRAQVRTECVCHAHGTGSVAPRDDLPAHPRLLDELLLAEPISQLDQVPAVGKRIKRLFASTVFIQARSSDTSTTYTWLVPV